MKKNIIALGLGIILAGTALTGCGASKLGSTEGQTTSKKTTASQGDTQQSTDKMYKIGIGQFAEHGSLDNCREGFLLGLKEEGFEEGKNLEISYENAQADMGMANQISQNFVSTGMDLICAIATPIAQSSYNAAKKTDIPVIYTAVTDPVAAQLATKDQKPTGNATGTSDRLPVKAQLEMIRELLPEAKNIGILYNTSEVNSVSTINEYKTLASQYGFTIVDTGISAAADIPLAVDSILSKVDCLNNLTDNLVVTSLPTILDKANKQNIPIFGSEIEQVKIGCAASEGIDYIELGKQTGKMAAQILKGEKKANDIPFEIIEQSSLYLNSAVLNNLNIPVSDDYTKKAIENFTEISK